tara:strand:+ start:1094 stop:1273 length:180 start_codon:yes stop_codon:yes gene_type:complete
LPGTASASGWIPIDSARLEEIGMKTDAVATFEVTVVVTETISMSARRSNGSGSSRNACR